MVMLSVVPLRRVVSVIELVYEGTVRVIGVADAVSLIYLVL